MFGMNAIAIFQWAARHVMPWLACFLAGAFWAGNRAEIKDLRAENKALIAADAENAGRATALADWIAAERERAAAVEAKRNEDYDAFQKRLAANRVVIRACVPDPRERDGVRAQVAAANEYALGLVRSGEGGVDRSDTPG